MGSSVKLKINAPECNYPYKTRIIIAPFGAIRNELYAIGRIKLGGKFMMRKNMKKIVGFLIVICLLSGAFAFFYGCKKNSEEIEPPSTNLSFLKTQGKDIVNEFGEKIVFKGVNFAHWIFWEGGGSLGLPNWSEHELLTRMALEMTPEKIDMFFELLRNYYITQSDFSNVKSMGVDFVRLTFHHRHVQENQIAQIDEAVNWAKQNGIYILLDLQAAPGSQNTAFHSDSDGNAYLWENQAYQDEFVRLWETIATKYKNEPAVMGYELMNEPESPSSSQLTSLYQRTITEIRAIDNKHIIFLDANNYAYDFTGFNPTQMGDNIAYAFHTYISLEETMTNVGKYKTFQETYNVPIFCTEYGGHEYQNQLTLYFQTEKISYASWFYKSVLNVPEATAFYYTTSEHPWRTTILAGIEEWLKTPAVSDNFVNELLSLLNSSGLSEDCKEDLIDILIIKKDLPAEVFRAMVDQYPNEINILNQLSQEVGNIRDVYIMDAFISLLQEMNVNELTILMQSLQTQYWEKGTAPL